MRWRTIAILVVNVLIYLLVGGAIFMALEKDNETAVATAQTGTFSTFLTENTCVTAAELETFSRAVVTAYDAGVTATTETTSESNWDYGASFFFAITVVTSIGYGNISPTTSGGQVFFIFYAIFGIPLAAVLLAGLGEKLLYPYKKVESKVFFPKKEKAENLVKRILVGCLFFAVMSLIPAAIFMAIEEWTYLEAWYYTIVTLTTVGFGDFVPGQNNANNRVLYRILVAVWIFVGLAWLSMMLNLIADAYKKQENKITGDKEKGEGDEENKDKGKENGKDNKIEMTPTEVTS